MDVFYMCQGSLWEPKQHPQNCGENEPLKGNKKDISQYWLWMMQTTFTDKHHLLSLLPVCKCTWVVTPKDASLVVDDGESLHSFDLSQKSSSCFMLWVRLEIFLSFFFLFLSRANIWKKVDNPILDPHKKSIYLHKINGLVRTRNSYQKIYIMGFTRCPPFLFLSFKNGSLLRCVPIFIGYQIVCLIWSFVIKLEKEPNLWHAWLVLLIVVTFWKRKRETRIWKLFVIMYSKQFPSQFQGRVVVDGGTLAPSFIGALVAISREALSPSTAIIAFEIRAGHLLQKWHWGLKLAFKPCGFVIHEANLIVLKGASNVLRAHWRPFEVLFSLGPWGAFQTFKDQKDWGASGIFLVLL